MKNIQQDIQRYKELIGNESAFKFKDYFRIFSPRLIPNVIYRTSYSLKEKGFRRISKCCSLFKRPHFLTLRSQLNVRLKVDFSYHIPLA